jgi:hypothetical protein
LSEEALETELIDVAVEVCFAGWFPDDAVGEEFCLSGTDEGVQAGFPGRIAISLLLGRISSGSRYKVVEEGGSSKELTVVVCPFDSIE